MIRNDLTGNRVHDMIYGPEELHTPVIITAERATLNLGGATGGTFVMGVGENTVQLLFDVNSGGLFSALNSIPGISLGTITVDAETFTIYYSASSGETLMTADFTGLVGATLPAYTVTVPYSEVDGEPVTQRNAAKGMGAKVQTRFAAEQIKREIVIAESDAVLHTAEIALVCAVI